MRIDGKRVYLVHREFPTDFRYDKKRLASDSYTEPYPLSGHQGSRGHYDIGVLNPRFVFDNSDVNVIRNKDIGDIERRADKDEAILLFAVEFKYITSNARSWIQQVLEYTKNWTGVTRGYSRLSICVLQRPLSVRGRIDRKSEVLAYKRQRRFHSFHRWKRRKTQATDEQPVLLQQVGSLDAASLDCTSNATGPAVEV